MAPEIISKEQEQKGSWIEIP